MTAKPTKPPFEEYPSWAHENLQVEFTKKTETQFGINTTAILNSVSGSEFCKELPELLRIAQKEYDQLHGVKLLMTPESPSFLKKNYASAIDKSYRSNILENRNWPNEPRWGWTTPANWCEKLNDLVRTTIVCKYLDGPIFLAKRLEDLAKAKGLQPRIQSHERDSGYYAQHFYAKVPVPLVDLEMEQTQALVEFEIQLTTQMQEVLRDLSHSFYEEKRLSQDDDRQWKWDHKSALFRSSFMGHTLHLLEGVIVELREMKNKKPKAGE
jgi:ppGpp synthetase/RelA/SpoT-type nucleotidyltranferase